MYQNIYKKLHTIIGSIHFHRLFARLPRHAKIGLGIIAFCLLVGSLTLFVRPVFAQSIVDQIVHLFTKKAGFDYNTDSSAFIFSKVTPNYTAYAGDQATSGGHKVRLLRDTAFIDVSFLDADSNQTPASPSGTTITLTPEQEQILTDAEIALEQEASMSAQGADSTSSASITPEKRVLIDQAKTILSAYAIPASTSAQTTDIASNSAALDDFLLLVSLKSFNIHRLSLDIDVKMATISRELNSMVSKARLVEEPRERKVSFSDPSLGITMDYRLSEGGINQDIIVKQQTQASTTFRYALDTHGLTYENIGHGVWYFSKPGDRPLMRIPKGWAEDAAGDLTNDVDITLTKVNGVHVMTIHVPVTWITDPTRSFPVTIHTSLEIVPELRNTQSENTHTSLQPTIQSTPTFILQTEGSASPSARSIASPSATLPPTLSPTATPSATLIPIESSPSVTPHIPLHPTEIQESAGQSTNSAMYNNTYQSILKNIKFSVLHVITHAYAFDNIKNISTILFVPVNTQWIYIKEHWFPIDIDQTIEVLPEQRLTRHHVGTLFSRIFDIHMSPTLTIPLQETNRRQS
jgi:hypothetical protein